MKPKFFFSLHQNDEGPTEQVTPIDRYIQGQCFTLRLTDEHISTYKFEFKKRAKIYFHNLGTMKSSLPRVYFRIDPDERMTITLEYTINTFLSTETEPCEENIDYNKDNCVDKELHQKSIDEVGCTTPWGTNKTMICMEKLKADKAVKLYSKFFWQGKHSCPKACTFSRIRVSVLYYNKNSTRNNSILHINLDDKVSYYESYFTYSGLSLVAEIGGYVGLFLGISVNQLYQMVNLVKSYLNRIMMTQKSQ